MLKILPQIPETILKNIEDFNIANNPEDYRKHYLSIRESVRDDECFDCILSLMNKKKLYNLFVEDEELHRTHYIRKLLLYFGPPIVVEYKKDHEDDYIDYINAKCYFGDFSSPNMDDLLDIAKSELFSPTTLERKYLYSKQIFLYNLILFFPEEFSCKKVEEDHMETYSSQVASKEIVVLNHISGPYLSDGALIVESNIKNSKSCNYQQLKNLSIKTICQHANIIHLENSPEAIKEKVNEINKIFQRADELYSLLKSNSHPEYTHNLKKLIDVIANSLRFYNLKIINFVSAYNEYEDGYYGDGKVYIMMNNKNNEIGKNKTFAHVVHELTHYIVYKIYDNMCLPYNEKNQKESYEKAVKNTIEISKENLLDIMKTMEETKEKALKKSDEGKIYYTMVEDVGHYSQYKQNAEYIARYYEILTAMLSSKNTLLHDNYHNNKYKSSKSSYTLKTTYLQKFNKIMAPMSDWIKEYFDKDLKIWDRNLGMQNMEVDTSIHLQPTPDNSPYKTELNNNFASYLKNTNNNRKGSADTALLAHNKLNDSVNSDNRIYQSIVDNNPKVEEQNVKLHAEEEDPSLLHEL